MPETDLDTANTKLVELEATHAKLETDHGVLFAASTLLETKAKELETAVEARDVEMAKLKDSTKNHDAAVTALQAKLTEAEGKAGSDPELKTKFDTLTTEHDTLKTRVSDSAKSRLKVQGLGDDLLANKSQSELDAMESALLVAKPAGTNPNGLGLGGGGTSVPATGTSLDHDQEVIKRAKQRAGVPT